jgi:hypothetical protein
MSYRDPKTIIQSTGKYYTQLSESLSRTAANVSQTIAAEAKERRESAIRRSKISRDYLMVTGNQMSEQAKEGEALFQIDYPALNSIVNNTAEIVALDISTPEQNRYAAAGNLMPARIGETIAMAKELTKDANFIIENTGQPGGLDPFAPQDVQSRYALIAGAVPGKSKLTGMITQDGTAEAKIELVNKEGNTFDATYSELKSILDSDDGQLGIVRPDLTKATTEIWNSTVLAQGADGKPKNTYRNSLFGESQRSDFNKVTGKTEAFKDPSVEKIAAAVYDKSRETIDGLSPTEQITEYNNLGSALGLDDGTGHSDYKTSLNKEEVEELTQRYISTMIEQKMGNDPKDHAVSTGTVVKAKPPTLTESDKKRIFNAQEVNDRGEFVVNKLQDAINNNDVASVFVDEVIGSKRDRIINADITEDKRYITLQLEGDVEDRRYDLKNENQLAKLVDDFVLIEYPKSGDQIKDWYRKSTETDIDPRIAKSNKSRSVQETVDPNAGKKTK